MKWRTSILGQARSALWRGPAALTPYALRELVKAIYIEAPDESGGKRRQEIRIECDLVCYLPPDQLIEREKQGRHD